MFSSVMTYSAVKPGTKKNRNFVCLRLILCVAQTSHLQTLLDGGKEIHIDHFESVVDYQAVS